MATKRGIRLTVTVEQKQPNLPRFVVVPAAKLRSWRLDGTTTVTGALAGVDFGRKNLKKWDERRWFLDLAGSLCKRAKIDVGDKVELVLERADTALPPELRQRLDRDAKARVAWSRLTASQQRDLREHVAAAKR